MQNENINERRISKNSPIGVFDSGIGGLSVVNELTRLLPNEEIIYFADSAYAPYGTKPIGDIRRRVDYIADLLYNLGVKAMLIACNTATSTSSKTLRARLPMEIIGMEPALKVAVDAGCKNIGVIATETTLREEKFETLASRFAGGVNVKKIAASELVNVIEAGRLSETDIHCALDEAVALLNGGEAGCDDAPLDGIVLGCTHFVLVKDEISAYFKGLPIFDGNLGTVRNLRAKLEERGLLRQEADSESVLPKDLKSGEELYGKILLINSDKMNTAGLKKYVK